MEMNINWTQWMSEIIYNEMLGGWDCSTKRKNIVRSYTLIRRYNLWAQHYSRLYSLYFSDLGQMRADLRGSPSPCPLRSPLQGFDTLRCSTFSMFLSYFSFFPLISGGEWSSNAWGSLWEGFVTGFCAQKAWDHPVRAHRSLWSCVLGIFMVNKDQYDLISEGFPKYFLGSLYPNLIS